MNMLGGSTFLMPNFLKKELSSAGADKLFSTPTMPQSQPSGTAVHEETLYALTRVHWILAVAGKGGGHPLLGTLALFLTILSH